MRARLSIVLLLLMTVVLVSLGLPLAASVAAGQAREMHADRLADLALYASLVPDDEGVEAQALERDLRRYDELYDVPVAVVDAAGRPLHGSRDDVPLDDPATRAVVAAAISGRLSEVPSRLWPWDDAPVPVAQPVVRDGDVVGAVVSVSPTGEARARVLRAWAELAALELVALVGGALLANRVAVWLLRPVARLDQAAHRIADGDLTTRVPAAGGPPELRRLGESFNGMAVNVQAAAEAQRAFVADASHQLRNPLAALLVRLEGLKVAPAEAFPAAAGAAADDGRYLADTLDRMLELAKAEHNPGAAGAVDVAAVVDERLRSWRLVAARRDIALDRLGAAAAPAWHDAGAVAGAVDAVIDNALKYSPEHTRVTVDVRSGAAGAEVLVTDEGPGLAPDELERVTDRFWRARGTSREPGSGLGMSIAGTLLERHGGRLGVGPAEHGGLEVRLQVPGQADGVRA